MAIHNGAGQAPRLARWLPASWFARNGCENEEQSTLVGLAVDDFQTFLFFTPKIGEMIQFDEYFSNGLKPWKQSTR